MKASTKLRGALGWAAIAAVCGGFLFLLDLPAARPWVIGAVMALMILTIAKIVLEVVRQQLRLDRKCAERLAFPIGMICLLAHMWWDRPLLQLIGLLLMLGSSARAWHESRGVSDSSGTITR